MNNKKILIFANEFPPMGGGAGVVAFDYCETLLKHGYEVTLITRKQNLNKNILPNLNIIEITFLPGIWFLFYFFKLRNINFDYFDCIILNDTLAGYMAGIFFNKNIFSKTVHILHGSEPEYIFLRPSVIYRLINYKKYYVRMIENSKVVIAVSNFMKEKFLKMTDLKCNNIVVSYAGVNVDLFNFNSSKKVKEISELAKEGNDILLTVSRIEEKKGFLRKYEIFKSLLKYNDNYKWIIVGNGKFLNRFKQIVLEDNLSSKIIFYGKIDRKELIKFYNSANVFWLLTELKESFGLVYLEAQSCGVPVIGPNRYGIKEAISPNECFLIEDNNEVLNILKEKTYNDSRKKDIISFASGFYKNKTDKKLIKIISDIINENMKNK